MKIGLKIYAKLFFIDNQQYLWDNDGEVNYRIPR